MSKAKVTDIILLAFISGLVAILTSMMGVSGTIIGAVVSSLIAESLKAYFKEPIKDRISEIEKQESYKNRRSTFSFGEDSIYDDFSLKDSYYKNSGHDSYNRKKSSDESFLSAKMIFIFPLIVILVIELIHFLGAIGFISYDIFYSLESITNWTLFRTIGYALVIMGIYPIVSKSFSTSNGVILIIVGVVELIFGYADVNVGAKIVFSLISSLREFVNIGIILAILYTILTISEEKSDTLKVHDF